MEIYKTRIESREKTPIILPDLKKSSKSLSKQGEERSVLEIISSYKKRKLEEQKHDEAGKILLETTQLLEDVS